MRLGLYDLNRTKSMRREGHGDAENETFTVFALSKKRPVEILFDYLFYNRSVISVVLKSWEYCRVFAVYKSLKENSLFLQFYFCAGKM